MAQPEPEPEPSAEPSAAEGAAAAEPCAEPPAFVPSEGFDGPREGYSFSTRDGQTGYWRDEPAKAVSFGAGGEERTYELSGEERAAKQAPAAEFLDFVVPDDAVPGTKLNLALPSGRMAEWFVPEGIEGGQHCRLPLPADEMGLTAMTRGVMAQEEGDDADDDAGSAKREEAERRREEKYLAMKREKELSGGYAVGDLVKSWQGDMATVRFIGKLEGKGEKVWMGVEWAEAGRGKNDGSVGEARYFSCAPGMGSFIDVKKREKFLDSRYNQYTDAIPAGVISSSTAG